jgi:hypothetical protein
MSDFKVEGFCDVLSHDQLKTADPILRFVVWWDYCGDFQLHLQSFFSSLPLGSLTSLDVVTDVDSAYLSPDFWRVAFGSTPTLTTAYLDDTHSTFWEALIPVGSDLQFSALSSVTVKDHFLDSELILDKLRIRSKLGGRQLQDLCISSEGCVPPAPIIKQLGELVSHVQVVESDANESGANGSSDADDSFDED